MLLAKLVQERLGEHPRALATYRHAGRRCQEAADDVTDLASGAQAGRFLTRSGTVGARAELVP